MSSAPTSDRRSSTISVTSSSSQKVEVKRGPARKKSHSLLRVVASLDLCSHPSDDGVSVRSRQLDFGGADDENEEDAGNRNRNAERNTGNVAKGRNARRRGRERRRTVFWSAEEEEFLRRGVIKYGIGKWKKILLDGDDVFSKHRTNADLKDKWKNMEKTNSTNRKRTAEVNDVAPPLKQEELPQVHHGSSASAKKSKCSEDATEISSMMGSRSRTGQRAAVVANKPLASAKRQEVDVDSLPSEEDTDYPGGGVGLASTGSYHRSKQIVLKFATDKSFPELIEVRVSLDACKNVSALKKLLRSSILSDLSPSAEIQMIGLKSRQLFEDDELLSQCITKKNGVDFFLVVEEAPELFV